ncbi:hypothetical protein HPB51_023742 [Rhipicephalus microplus]|uniref:Uncharacterized protein n=1 Tax=Rhipicephalus microplus TaxID=6941 RepID=A0A9J6EJZ5_RHIMP|nr:hypothetical protein HPB51_023742 [Rhipicephalus microplus]
MFPFPQNFQEDPACRLADLAVANRLLSLTWFVTSKWREKQAAPLRVTLWKYTTARLPSNLGSAHGFLVYGGTCRAGVIFYFLLPRWASYLPDSSFHPAGPRGLLENRFQVVSRAGKKADPPRRRDVVSLEPQDPWMFWSCFYVYAHGVLLCSAAPSRRRLQMAAMHLQTMWSAREGG